MNTGLSTDAFSAIESKLNDGSYRINNDGPVIETKEGKLVHWNGNKIEICEPYYRFDPTFLQGFRKTFQNYNNISSANAASRTGSRGASKGQWCPVKVNYKKQDGSFRSPDEQAESLLTGIKSTLANLPLGQKVYIIYSTGPDGMRRSHQNDTLDQTMGGFQAKVLHALHKKIAGTPLEAQVRAAPMPIDKATRQNVKDAIQHINTLISGGAIVMPLSNEDCSPRNKYAYGITNGRPRTNFNGNIVLKIQVQLEMLEQKCAQNGTVSTASTATVGASSASVGSLSDRLKILDINDQPDAAESREAVHILKPVIDSGAMEVVPSRDIKNINSTCCSILDGMPYNTRGEGEILKYKNGVGSSFQYVSVEEVVGGLKANNKFVCPTSTQDILKMDSSTGVAASCIGQGKTGNCPPGTMNIRLERSSVAGYPLDGMIVIDYNLPGGTQTKEHPNAGTPFSGTRRTCYLPTSFEGTKVFAMLIKAWERRQTFDIGFSATDGKDNRIIWNDIHHKTHPNGGAHGFPDPNYLSNVTGELAVKGIKPEIIKGMNLSNRTTPDGMTITGITSDLYALLNQHTR